MASPAIDYDALAKQYGAVSSTPTGAAPVDYDALAKQHGATSSTAAPGFGQQFLDATRDRLKDVGSAVYGASATANRIFANLAETGENVVRNTAGIEAASPLLSLKNTFRQNQEAQQAEAQRLAGGRNDLAGQITRGVTQGVLELPQYAVAAHVAGPVGGMAAIGGITEADKGWAPALQAAAEGALTGGTLHVMGGASRPIRLTGASLMEWAKAKLQGADDTTALAQATTMGLLAGHAPGGATAREFVPGLDTAITTAGRAAEATRAGARAAAPDVGMGVVKAGVGYLAGEAAGMVPGGGFVKHILDIPTAYIGARQIGRGLKKGAGAFRASMAETAPPETTAAEPAATGPGPAGAPTDDAILHLYSVETNPAKRAALRTELIDRGLMNDPNAPPAPGENPYRGYTQTALRNVYEIEPDAGKRALIEQAAKSRGLSLLNREGRRATAAPPETEAEVRGPSLTQDDVLLLRYLGEENPQAADADTIGIARQLAAEKPGLLERFRRGEPEPAVPPVTAEEAAAPAVQSLGTLEYTAPGVPPERPQPAAAPAAAETAPPPGKPAAADIAQQLEASSRPDRMLDFLRRMDPEITADALDSIAPHEWAMVAEGAGSPRGTAPTAEDIQTIRENLTGIKAQEPAAAVAEFEQKRTTRTRRKAAPAAEPDLESQLGESLAKVKAGERPVAQVPEEQPRAATASDKRVEAYAQHFAADPGTAIADIEPLTKLPEFPKLGRALEIDGALAPGEAERIAARVKELRGEAAAAPAAIIKPDAESTPTVGSPTGEQSGSPRAPLYGSREPKAPVASGSATSVRIPGERTAYEGQYAVRELDDVHASHNAHTFEKNPNYQLRNDRDYSNPVNKERVVVNSKGDTFDPAYVLADSPDATNGAPVIDADGNVLGGNSRAMILDRVYKNNPDGAAAYRAELARRASQFGIDPEQLAGMKRPVLVRQLSDTGLNPQRAITDLNKTGTAALTTAERATADARRITPAAADYLANAIDTEGADATLNDVLSGKGGLAIVNRLVDDGVFTMQERPNLIDTKTGAVTAAAKERISKLLLGQVFEDADQMTRTPAEVRNKLERTVSPILQSGQKPGFDIRPAVRQALDVLEYARAHGITRMNDLLAQESMFEDAPKFSAQTADLAQFIQDSKPTAIAKAFRRYLANAEPTMFGKSTPAEAFADAFGTPAPPATLREFMQPEPPAAAAPRKRRSKPVR
jgi:hypothetical protein